MPALGAVLLLAGWGLIDVQALRGFWKLSRFEFSLCLLTTVGVLSVGVLPGIFVAVSIAVLRLLYYTYRPSDAVLGWMHGIDGQVELAKYPQATTLPGLVIYRFDAPCCSSTPTTSSSGCLPWWTAASGRMRCCSTPRP